MNTAVFPSQDPARSGMGSPRPFAATAALAARAWRGDPTLVVFGAALFVLAAAMTIGIAVDDRTLRGVNVWIKPFKFATSIALLAWTTALFTGFVDAGHRRRSRSLVALRWAVLVAGGFEMAYIGVQAALGQASHFNVGDPFHATMYTLMGVGAIALTATQPWLAWHVARHAEPSLDRAVHLAIVLGLVLTFVLGAGAGIAMGGGVAPSNAGGLPIVGWTFGSGDLRPAHFVGIHAGQALPLFAAWLVSRRLAPVPAKAAVWAFAASWTLLFAAAMAVAFAGMAIRTAAILGVG